MKIAVCDDDRPKELVTATGRCVPIARAAYQQVRTAYTEFLFRDADMAAKRGGII